MCKKLSRLVFLMSVSMGMQPASSSAAPMQAQQGQRVSIALTREGDPSGGVVSFISSNSSVGVAGPVEVLVEAESITLTFDKFKFDKDKQYEFSLKLSSHVMTIASVFLPKTGNYQFTDGNVEINFKLEQFNQYCNDPSQADKFDNLAKEIIADLSSAGASSSSALPAFTIPTQLTGGINVEVQQARRAILEVLSEIDAAKESHLRPADPASTSGVTPVAAVPAASSTATPAQATTAIEKLSAYTKGEILFCLVEALLHGPFELTQEEKWHLMSTALNARKPESLDSAIGMVKDKINSIKNINPSVALSKVSKIMLLELERTAPVPVERIKLIRELLGLLPKLDPASNTDHIIIKLIDVKLIAWSDGNWQVLEDAIYMLKNSKKDSLEDLIGYRVKPSPASQSMLLILFTEMNNVSDRALCFLLREFEEYVIKGLTGLGIHRTPYWWTPGAATPGEFFYDQNWGELLREYVVSFNATKRSYKQGDRPGIPTLAVQFDPNQEGQEEFYLHILGEDSESWELIKGAAEATAKLTNTLNKLPSDIDHAVGKIYDSVLYELTCGQPALKNHHLLLCLAFSLQNKFLAPWVYVFKNYLEAFKKNMEDGTNVEEDGTNVEEVVLKMYMHENQGLSIARYSAKDVMVGVRYALAKSSTKWSDAALVASTTTPLSILAGRTINPARDPSSKPTFSGQDSATMDGLVERGDKLSCLIGILGIVVVNTPNGICLRLRKPEEAGLLLETMVLRLKFGLQGIGQFPCGDYMSTLLDQASSGSSSKKLVLAKNGTFVAADEVLKNGGLLSAFDPQLLRAFDPQLVNTDNRQQITEAFSKMKAYERYLRNPSQFATQEPKLRVLQSDKRLPEKKHLLFGLPEIDASLSFYFLTMYTFCALLLENEFTSDLVGLSILLLGINAITKNLPVPQISSKIEMPEGSAFIVHAIKQFTYAIIASFLLLYMMCYHMPLWLIYNINAALECLAMGVMVVNILSVDKTTPKIFIYLAFASTPFLSPYFMAYLYPYIPARLINSLSVWYLKTLGEPFNPLIMVGYCYNFIYLMYLITSLKNCPNDDASLINFALLCGASGAIIISDFTITVQYILIILAIYIYAVKAAFDLPRERGRYPSKLSIEHVPYENDTGKPTPEMQAAIHAGLAQVSGWYEGLSWRLFYLPIWHDGSKARIHKALLEAKKESLLQEDYDFRLPIDVSKLRESLDKNLLIFGKRKTPDKTIDQQVGRLLDLYAISRTMEDLTYQFSSESGPVEPFHRSLEKLHEQRQGLLKSVPWCMDSDAEGFIPKEQLLEVYQQYVTTSRDCEAGLINYYKRAFAQFADAEIILMQTLLSESFKPDRPDPKFYLDYVCPPKSFHANRRRIPKQDLISLAQTMAQITGREFIFPILPPIIAFDDAYLKEKKEQISMLADNLESRIARRTVVIGSGTTNLGLLALYDLAEWATESYDPMTRLSIEWTRACQSDVLHEFAQFQLGPNPTPEESAIAADIVATMNEISDQSTLYKVADAIYRKFKNPSIQSPKIADIFRKFGNYCLLIEMPKVALYWFCLAYNYLNTPTDMHDMHTSYTRSYCFRSCAILNLNPLGKLVYLIHSANTLEALYPIADVSKKVVVAKDIIEALTMIQEQVDLFLPADLQQIINTHYGSTPLDATTPAARARTDYLKDYLNIWKTIITTEKPVLLSITIDASQSYLKEVISDRALSPWELVMVIYANDAQKYAYKAEKPYFEWVKEKVYATSIPIEKGIVNFSGETSNPPAIKIKGAFQSTPPYSVFEKHKHMYCSLFKQSRPFDLADCDPKEITRAAAVNTMLIILAYSKALEPDLDLQIARIRLKPFVPILRGLNQYTADERGRRDLLSNEKLAPLIKEPNTESLTAEQIKDETAKANRLSANLSQIFAELLRAESYQLDFTISTIYAKLGEIWNAEWINPTQVKTLLDYMPAVLLVNCLPDSERPSFWQQALKNQKAAEFFDPGKMKNCLDRALEQNRRGIQGYRPKSEYKAILDIFVSIQREHISAAQSLQRDKILRITIAVMLTCMQFLPNLPEEHWKYYLDIWAAWYKSNKSESSAIPSVATVLGFLKDNLDNEDASLPRLAAVCGVDFSNDLNACKALNSKEALLVATELDRLRRSA